MKSYLLAWNPNRWQWDNLTEESRGVKNGDLIHIRWSCGRSRRIEKGDRAFLIRLGQDPRGIFASGEIIVGSYEDEHWEESSAAAGRTSMYVKIQLDTLLDPEVDAILPRELLRDSFPSMHWDTQMSGVSIPDRVAAELEMIWAQFALGRLDVDIMQDNNSLSEVGDVDDLRSLRERALTYSATARGSTEVSRQVRYRSEAVRTYVLRRANGVCEACRQNAPFVTANGRPYLEAHHLRQLSDEGPDHPRWVAALCPNCHRKAHYGMSRDQFNQRLAGIVGEIENRAGI